MASRDRGAHAGRRSWRPHHVRSHWYDESSKPTRRARVRFLTQGKALGQTQTRARSMMQEGRRHGSAIASIQQQELPRSRSGRFRLSVNKIERQFWRKCRSGWGSHSGGAAMTEYTVKEIGHQWIVYADRQSIATCADETSALKLIAEDSAANGVTRKSRVQGFRASKNPRA
jgi:hypothetical protein